MLLTDDLSPASSFSILLIFLFLCHWYFAYIYSCVRVSEGLELKLQTGMNCHAGSLFWRPEVRCLILFVLDYFGAWSFSCCCCCCSIWILGFFSISVKRTWHWFVYYLRKVSMPEDLWKFSKCRIHTGASWWTSGTLRELRNSLT